MKKIFILCLSLFVITNLFASDIQVDGIWYDFDASTKTASVTYQGSSYFSHPDRYSGSVIIPEKVTYNGTTYFVTTIGYDAFAGCSGLTSITIPNSVITISSAFYNCTSLTSVTIPNSVTKIEGFTFSGCTRLTSVTIGNSVTTIGGYAFSNCGLKSITIPNSVTTIGEYAFERCISLTSVTIGNSVTTIGEHAFYWCTKLNSVTIGNSVTTIGTHAFAFCDSLTSITIPNSVVTIRDYAFRDCEGLTSATIGNSVIIIGKYAFEDCAKLTTVTIPNSVTTIGERAFCNCSSLTSVTIPNSVTMIGKDAFNGVINIAYNGTATGSPWGAKCVNGYVDGYLVFSDTTKTTLCRCATAAKGKVIIPNSVKTIGDWAFTDCYGLTTVTIPNSVKTIGDGAFTDCFRLTTVTIPNSVKTIGWVAFSGCSGLTSITIPNSVTTIGSSAFSRCISLTSITCYAITPPKCDNVFDGISQDAKVYVPASALVDYQNAEDWKDLLLLPIAADVTPMDNENPIVTPTDQDVTITWLITDGTDTYTLTITKNSETFCVLTFKANGQLTNIAFAAHSHNSPHQAPTATLTAQGYQFTVTGLEYATKYNYHISARNSAQEELYYFEGTFVTKSLSYQVTTSAENGIVSGAGTYDYGTEVTLTATPNEHYHFVQWSDGVKDNPRTITVIGDTTYSAIFAIDQFTISVVAENGAVSGTGTYDYGTEVTLTATPNEGYEFVDWSNGITYNPYTFIVDQDVDLTANFKKIDTGWQDIQSGVKASKYFHNGNLIIERNGIKYTATGQKVR